MVCGALVTVVALLQVHAKKQIAHIVVDQLGLLQLHAKKQIAHCKLVVSEQGPVTSSMWLCMCFVLLSHPELCVALRIPALAQLCFAGQSCEPC